jgi:hypothetical protein
MQENAMVLGDYYPTCSREEWLENQQADEAHEARVRARWFKEYCTRRADGECHEDACNDFPSFGDAFLAEYNEAAL